MTSARKPPSVFDYTITLTRKHRYLVIGCQEFEFQLAAECLDLGSLSPDVIGKAVMHVLERVRAKLHEHEVNQTSPPLPQQRHLRALQRAPERISAARAARMLGISKSTLRRIAHRGELPAERTPGGHFRFTLEDLSNYLGEGERAA